MYNLPHTSILAVKTEEEPRTFPEIKNWPLYLGVFTHRWQLTNFDLDSCQREIESETFRRHHDTSTEFKMILVRGNVGASKHINIRLALVHCMTLPMFVTVTFTVSNNLHETDSFTFTHYFLNPLEIALSNDKMFPGMPWGYPKDGGLDIYCTITANLCRPSSVGRIDGMACTYAYFQEVPHYRRFKADPKFKDGVICSRHFSANDNSILLEYPVHRGLVVSASNLCHRLFSELRSTDEQRIYVPDIPRVIMEVVLEYMYTGWTTSFQRKHFGRMEDLVKAANILEMYDLKSLSEYELGDSLTLNHCIPLLKLAMANNCTEWLKPRIIHFMRSFKNRIIKSKAFEDLREENLDLAKEVYPEDFEVTSSEINPSVQEEVELKYGQYVIPKMIDM